MVAYVTNGVFVQAWIGVEDKLPRRVRAAYLNDPAQLRHEMELSNWQIDLPVATELFRIGEGGSGDTHAVCPSGAKACSEHQTPVEEQGHESSHPKPSEEASHHEQDRYRPSQDS